MRRCPREPGETGLAGRRVRTWPGVWAWPASLLLVLAKRTIRGRWPPGRTRLCRVATAWAASGTEPIWTSAATGRPTACAARTRQETTRPLAEKRCTMSRMPQWVGRPLV